jgi:AmmeMemoRadiSam system protein B
MRHAIRAAAVAGTWYPASADALRSAVERHLADADASSSVAGDSSIIAIVAPHAGLVYSGPVAAHAYRLLRGRELDLVVLVGPSHFVPFDGVAVYPRGGFATPLGVAEIDDACAAQLMAETSIVRELPEMHVREHSLEMQLPFVRHLAPGARIVPLLMGMQTAATARALSTALHAVLKQRIGGGRVVIVASSDLSHYHDAVTAARLDGVVVDRVSALDPDGLQHDLDRRPDHACGGGPMVAVMRAARALGATQASILRYADSGDVSGDKTAVVGYLAAAFRGGAHGATGHAH